MPRYDVKMRVIHEETWSVEAANEADARKMIADIDDEVDTDDVGEIVDWDIISIKIATA